MNKLSAFHGFPVHTREVLGAAAIACLCCVASSVAVTIFAEFNARNPRYVWFPIPTLLAAWWVVSEVEAQVQRSRDVTYNLRLWATIGVLVLIASFAGLTGTGWSHILNGTALLHGELRFPQGLFLTCYPFVVEAAGGVVEEATIRGLFQLKVRQWIGNMYSQIAAGIMFVVLHGTVALEPGRLLSLSTVALFSGLLAAKTDSVVPSAIFHAAVNVSIAIAVLAFRP